MKFEKEKILVFYKLLISLYPRAFRERFEESMAQTFNDICNEQAKGEISLGFVVSMFAETSIGVIKENLAGRTWMNYWLKTIGGAAFFSLFFTGAFFTIGTFLTDNPDTRSDSFSFPVMDFFRSWMILTLVLTPIISGLQAGESISMKGWFAILSGAFLFGLVLTAPFAFMEYWNNPVIRSGEIQFPFALFFGLWFVPTVFFLGAVPIVRNVWAGESVLAHPVSLLMRVIFLAIMAILWINLIRDQMPCFLGGVPGCD